MPSDTFDKTCAACRFHTTEKRPHPTSSGALYDTQVEFEDEDAVVFHCRAPQGPFSGKEIGVLPVFCDAFVLGTRTAANAQLDARMAAAEARWAARPDREER